MRLTSTFIASSPEINATALGAKIEVLIVNDESTKVSTHAPKIVGIPKSSEKYIASVFLIPRYIPVTRVTPDLEIPGTRAKAWAKPTINDCFSEISWNEILFSLRRFIEINKNIEKIK